jgi:hypothetical protein
MTKTVEEDVKDNSRLAILLATWLKKTYVIREASYQEVRTDPYQDGHYTKDWEQCATEAGMPSVFHPLVPLLGHWGNDTQDWIESILGQ